MIIGLVRDSVMQCFCHTCRVPVLPAGTKRTVPFKKPTKIRAKQPLKSSKKVKFIATEIRCQEKSKGGLSYEVILAEPLPNVATPPIKRNTVDAMKNLSVQEIERKLKEAEERRLSLEAKKMADWSAKMVKIEEMTRKRDEINNEFMNNTKENLDAKMEQCEEKRDAIITDIKEKLKVHAQDIERTRKSLEEQKNLERIAIEDKLKTAATMRDERIKKMLERLKEHNIYKLAELKIAADERENEKSLERKHIFDNKLFVAELNREREIQKKLENIRKHDRRAEIVRLNKAAITNRLTDNDQQLITTTSE